MFPKRLRVSRVIPARMTPSTYVSVLGLLVAFSVPALGLLRRLQDDADRVDWPQVGRSIALKASLLAIVVVLVAVAGSPADLGIRVRSRGVLLYYVGIGLLAYGGTMVTVSLLERLSGSITAEPATLVVLNRPLFDRLAAGVTGASVDSLLYYGVAIEAVLALGGGPVVAGSVGAGGLLLARVRWGVRTVLRWTPVAVVFSIITLLSGSVVPVLVTRLVYDVVAYASSDPADFAAREAA